MDAAFLILVVGLFVFYLVFFYNSGDSSISSDEQRRINSKDHESKFAESVEQFRQKHLTPRINYLEKLNAEIEKCSINENAKRSGELEDSDAGRKLLNDLQQLAYQDWCEHFKEKDEIKASLIKQARINEFKSCRSDLLNERDSLLGEIDSLEIEKDKIVEDTKTYVAMMEKLNER